MIQFKDFFWLGGIGLASAGQAQTAHWQLLLGQRSYDNKVYKEAAAHFREAGNIPEASFNTGNAAYALGDWDKAISAFEKASQHSAQKPDALYQLGNAYLRAGQYDEAVKAYEGSLRLKPNQPDAKKNLQIAKRHQAPPPPEQEPPPPPPPPRTPPPRSTWLDQARASRETTPVPLTPDAARKLLETAVLPNETENARQYRKLSPDNRPVKGKKTW